MTRPSTRSYTPSFGFPVSGWFRWFAWRPVDTIDRGWRWMRPLWRRRIAKHEYLSGGADFWWQTVVDPAPNSAYESPAPATAPEAPKSRSVHVHDLEGERPMTEQKAQETGDTLPTRPRTLSVSFDDLTEQAELWLLNTLSELIYGCPWLNDAAISGAPSERW